MCRKLTGIFILFCFLMVKNGPLTIFDTIKHPVLLSMLTELPTEQEDNELPEENKSPKQLEYADEDFIYQSGLKCVFALPLSKRLDNYNVQQILPTYFSLPNPPPDGI